MFSKKHNNNGDVGIMQAWILKEKPKFNNYWKTIECFSCFSRTKRKITDSSTTNANNCTTPVVSITILPDSLQG